MSQPIPQRVHALYFCRAIRLGVWGSGFGICNLLVGFLDLPGLVTLNYPCTG